MVKKDQIYKAKILIVDDEEVNTRLLEEMLRKSGYQNLTLTNISKDAPILYGEIRPDLVLLDLHMPEMNGFEVMSQIKEIEGDNYMPVMVLSNEESQDIRFQALQSGAKDFLNKPYNRIEVLLRIHNLIEVRLLHMQVRLQNKALEDKVKQRTQEVYETQLDVMQRLGRAIEYRDSETGMHIIRMSHYSACLAARLDLSLEDCEMILTASPLHDIGKIGIPDAILRKPGKLTPQEWEIMKTHTTIGAELLSGSNSRFLTMARDIALTHHERFDGTGYPNGLKGEDIPIVGRICGLCDVFDALLSHRPYKRAWTLDETLKEIQRTSGSHFDPIVVDAFMNILPQILHITEKYVDRDERR